MTVMTGFFVWRSEPDGTSVSVLELERLHRADRKAELIARFKTDDERAGMQLEEQHRADRVRHIVARLRSEAGHAVEDFARANKRGIAEVDLDRER